MIKPIPYVCPCKACVEFREIVKGMKTGVTTGSQKVVNPKATKPLCPNPNPSNTYVNDDFRDCGDKG